MPAKNNNQQPLIIPLSTYYTPFIRTNVNVTQSVGYMAFDTEEEAEKMCGIITHNEYKTIIHLTRYGNFNNIMVLKHLNFKKYRISKKEKELIDTICSKIRY